MERELRCECTKEIICVVLLVIGDIVSVLIEVIVVLWESK